MRRWDKDGTLIAHRTPSQHRFYDESHLRQLYGVPKEQKKIIFYCRVSSNGQKEDLKSQRAACESRVIISKARDGGRFDGDDTCFLVSALWIKAIQKCIETSSA